MKKILFERGLAFFLVFIAFVVSGYLYQQGKISFFPKKVNPSLQTMVVEIPFKEKEYKLSYKDTNLSSVFEISRFEDNEKWIGDGEFDYSGYFEGRSSLSLSSQSHSKSIATLRLKDGFGFEEFQNFKFLVNLRSDKANIQEFNLLFIEESSGEEYRYPIRELSEGWNLLEVPKDKFSVVTHEPQKETEERPLSGIEQEIVSTPVNVNKVVFELVSRPRTAALTNIDFIWAEKSEDYLEDWAINNPKFLFFKKNPTSLNFGLIGIERTVANIKRITSARDYSLKIKFTPLRQGFFGFFLRGNFETGYGYYLGLDGVDTNTWQIYKMGVFDDKQQTVVLAEGTITNFKTEKDHNYWLKAQVGGSHLSLFLSLDGKTYSKIGEAYDDSFVFGGVGIASLGSMYTIDDLQFSQ